MISNKLEKKEERKEKKEDGTKKNGKNWWIWVFLSQIAWNYENKKKITSVEMRRNF